MGLFVFMKHLGVRYHKMLRGQARTRKICYNIP